MDNQVVLQMDHLYKSYGEGETRVEVLKDISLTIKKGEFVAILGPSGSGKSTLMNIIGLIDTHDSGDYFLDGVDIQGRTENEYAEIRNNKIGFVFQKFNLISKYTALQNVALPLLLRGYSFSEASDYAYTMLSAVGLGDRLSHKTTQLSGGQQQRVAIARALVGNAEILLADEPTGALDSKNGLEVLKIFKQLNDYEKTIILITHDINIAKQAKRIVRIKDGILEENVELA